MDKIYKYFTQKKEKKINRVKMNMGLLQGLDHLNRRNQQILEGTNHFKFNENVRKNMIEGNQNMKGDIGSQYGVNLAGFNKRDKSIVERELKKFKSLQNNYNLNLRTYQKKYRELLTEYMKYELGDGENVTSGAVHKCKVACNTENSSEAHKTACEVGCTLKGPYLLDCQNTFKADSVNSCSKTIETNKCNPLKKQPIDTYYSELSQAKDEKGVSLVDGCCECGGGKFGSPSAIVNNNKYTSCYDFNNTTEINKCLNARITNEASIKNLPKKYKEVLKLNKNMISFSDEMLSVVNSLKDFNIDLTVSKNNLQRNYNDDSMKYSMLLKEIAKFTKEKKNTLNTRVMDGQLKKSAFDFRNNIWTILAIAFGTVALYKIKDL